MRMIKKAPEVRAVIMCTLDLQPTINIQCGQHLKFYATTQRNHETFIILALVSSFVQFL